MATLGHNAWHMDDIDDALAADFDGSLSGLGIELGTASFNMSETLLALPSIKDESVTGGHPQAVHAHQAVAQAQAAAQAAQSRIKKNRPLQAEEEAAPTTIKRFCNDPNQNVASSASSSCSSNQKHSSSAPDLRHCANDTGILLLQSTLPGAPVSPSGAPACLGSGPISGCQPMFQCVLGAATSIATKVNERTMTYLNQGQSYEIKLKKLGDLTEMQGKLLKSVVRVGFQERRLQYMEKEQMEQWAIQHPQERVLDVDIPLSYGVFDVVSYSKLINAFEFVWDPTKETGVFVRLNCISTEFTPKKHGGEKGVPFRLVVETYSTDGGNLIQGKLHSASCQVKVFKPKGADRKHKTDREKMSKRPIAEQELYQPSFDCTFFTECTQQAAYSQQSPAETPTKMPSAGPGSVSSTSGGSGSGGGGGGGASSSGGGGPGSTGNGGSAAMTPTYPPSPPEPQITAPITPLGISQRVSISPSTSITGSDSDETALLTSDASPQETADWLRSNRFSNALQQLGSFSGADLLRLNKNDLITICGVAEGIRLYNLLHAKAIRPALTLYMGNTLDEPFVPVFLEKATAYQLKSAISSAMCVPCDLLFLKGPGGIRVSVTDELVRNLSDEAAYLLEAHDKVLLMTPARIEGGTGTTQQGSTDL
ncbi:transcription factor CP2-like protein 1 isoform X1 [Varroa jacobsoni]|uniref:Grh/CP2 DB domain-containing protein n=1 Tax=Varroa destructor TaxID=109461 RepID=A0A7M7K4M3_VARDE|nr:transcription factor CP2-like protein 1 isoform X1 [Varroa destructor]XP_022661433.1 transcription factor CP2-like protein 1 isoform X1 [Varroa destructor]XP_022688016.1 transcription factor CP2-like protein 1 isoform X1 [Varroa jacobsoni]XP_022688017.1 transcription factor CP2-like protein 1 isoform X1 [Varroa jacobsoni]